MLLKVVTGINSKFATSIMCIPTAFARATGVGLDGNPVTHEGDELMGRVLQHEIDHLNGILLLERLPRRTRKQALRELRNEALGLAPPG